MRWLSRSTRSARPRSFIGLGPWRNVEDVEFATLEWVDRFNNRRLLEPIGETPPVEFEQMVRSGHFDIEMDATLMGSGEAGYESNLAFMSERV